MSKTINETVGELHQSLSDYIEATYHIGDPVLVDQRKELLDTIGIIHQETYLESTPRYKGGDVFATIPNIPTAALQLYESLSTNLPDHPRLIYNPPYAHQWQSIKSSLVEQKNLVIMTGTGSGKTESFLLPIAGKLARESEERPESFAKHAVRALILYPMNALVNDQLARLRRILGDDRTKKCFDKWSGRIPTFARYTSRTPYAGVREVRKDQAKLRTYEDFYVAVENGRSSQDEIIKGQANSIFTQLQTKGKWPAKPSISKWYGQKNERWLNPKEEFTRCITLEEDSELLTRHEVQANPPDLLITNYSMLEYMLMRPIERTIFEKTAQWLSDNPHEKFLIVIDEAHLYRGASGAEVGLLLRRLRERLGIEAHRFQVICSTASFEDKKYALEFAAKLSGTPVELFVPILGEFLKKDVSNSPTKKEGVVLAEISVDEFYHSNDELKLKVLSKFLNHRLIQFERNIEFTLFQALKNYDPLNRLINLSMGNARSIDQLTKLIFPENSSEEAASALTALIALGSLAREKENEAGLLPCRVHTFFRGLPGLWICMNPHCNQIPESQRGNTSGKLFGQPRERCDCGARVFELFTCRNCGSIHARAYTDNLTYPTLLWSNPGQDIRLFSSKFTQLYSLDILLEEPVKVDKTEQAYLDFITGSLNPENSPEETRRVVYLNKDRSSVTSEEDEDGSEINPSDFPGQFVVCAVCARSGGPRKPAVQDHQTKGNQPFLSILSKQIQIQPVNRELVSDFAPLGGRKVLIFSDSRQTAARLAPDLQMYSLRDAVRPLIVWGYKKLESIPDISAELNLNDAYLALLIAANHFQIRLRPELGGSETFYQHDQQIRNEIFKGVFDDSSKFFKFFIRFRDERAPESILKEIVHAISDRFLGLDALAVASISTKDEVVDEIKTLPNLGTLANSLDSKIALVNHWIMSWQSAGYWFKSMPASWWKPSEDRIREGVKGHKSGKFRSFDKILNTKDNKKMFNDQWLPKLLSLFCESPDSVYRVLAKNLKLTFDNQWIRCSTCSAVYKPIPNSSKCIVCGCETTYNLDVENDAVFVARKGYYRKGVSDILSSPAILPMALIAAEHTAQLNAAQTEAVFSQAEQNELLFQDIDIEWPIGKKANRAIDILSSTTTMEVGIDIGALSGVALRNMPPGRANYQQRAGRAGRRGNAVATVVAFGSADSHDEHYFTNPEEMISGPVVDPILSLDNIDISKRHVRAFLLQKYLQARLPAVNPNIPSNLFSVLGKVRNFFFENSVLNRFDFISWLNANGELLKIKVSDWIPTDIPERERKQLIDAMLVDCISAIDDAIDYDEQKLKAMIAEGQDDQASEEIEVESEEDYGKISLDDNLLDRLLYRGKLPRYAFPTDVATFYVFDSKSIPFRPVMKFAPSQGLPIALSQYAPDKQIWIANKCYTSSAIYSPIRGERENAWAKKRLYYECLNCGFAKTTEYNKVDKDLITECQACGEPLQKPSNWFRPTGFAHPIDKPEETSPDSSLDVSYATRAKLYMPSPADDKWKIINARLKSLKVRTHLLVSNTGPAGEGYEYCVSCGRIEASVNSTGLLKGVHDKPFPDHDPQCPGFVSKIVLGTDFITDVGLFSINLGKVIRLLPGNYSTDVALRTVCEALAIAASFILEIEAKDIMAEYRPALNRKGKAGEEFEIFLYDTLPGGAGFSTQLADRTEDLYRRALDVMINCEESCDSSCYRCLRSFKNRFDHGSLDRHVGIELIKYIINDQLAEFDITRIKKATNILFDDVYRNLPSTFKVVKGFSGGGTDQEGVITIEHEGTARLTIAVSGPLTPRLPANRTAMEIYKGTIQSQLNIIPIDEFLILKHLPSATKSILERLE